MVWEPGVAVWKRAMAVEAERSGLKGVQMALTLVSD